MSLVYIPNGEFRRYIIRCDTVRTFGISGTTVVEFFNLTDAFTGGTNIYSGITMQDLSRLTDEEYLTRLDDYLTFIGGVDEQERLSLITGSTGTTDDCLFPTIKLQFDQVSEGSKILFNLSGSPVEFTGVSIVTNVNEFLASTNGTNSASSFEQQVNNYLILNGLNGNYDVSRDDNVVTIHGIIQDSVLNFDFVNIIDNTIVDTSEFIESGNTSNSIDKTYYLPGNIESQGDQFVNILNDDNILVVDMYGGDTPDAVEIIKNGNVVATTYMENVDISGRTTNFGFPNGIFRETSPRNSIDAFYVGNKTPFGITPSSPSSPVTITSSNANIPSRNSFFISDTDIVSLPIQKIDFSGQTFTAHQRLWIKDLKQSDKIEIRIVSAIPNGKDLVLNKTIDWGVKLTQLDKTANNIRVLLINNL